MRLACVADELKFSSSAMQAGLRRVSLGSEFSWSEFSGSSFS